MAKRARFTLQDLKASKVANLNPHAFEMGPPSPNKYKVSPGGMCKEAQWMWGQLAWWSLDTGVPVVKEFRFNPGRKWRFDFAIPSKMIGIEYEGINSKKSGHTTLPGYTKDTEKYNSAQQLGWTVLRFTVKNYKTVLKELDTTISTAKQ